MLTFLLLSSSLFIIVLGITLTFSRTAWVMGGGSLLFTVPYFLCTTPHLRRTAFTLFATFLVSVGFAFCILKPFVLPRAAVRAAEPSVTERVQYLKLGFGIIHERPQGVGMGNQVLYAQNYGLYGAYGIVRGAGQPVHNTYLLVADEVGFFGGVAFALILIGTLWRGIRWGALSLERATSLVMLGGVLASGLVDHFPWTLEQGRLLFTLALGIVVAQSKRP
jgi:O-antigen ligase